MEKLKNQKIDKSKKAFDQAKKVLVGGVNSPVRAFGAVRGTPRFIDRADGAYMVDVDGNRYIDFLGSWGPMIFGHRPKSVAKAVLKAIEKGTSFGAPTSGEADLAKLIRSAHPHMEKVRLTTSGTEATMSAIRLARGFTKRDRIVKFEGCYHGHSDSLLVAAGSGATTFGVPSSHGVPSDLARLTWVLPYNDIAALESLFRTQGPNIAGVIIEPVCGNMGVVVPTQPFLARLRELTKKFGALLIFDEVMTGFRVQWGGAQKLWGITPDLTCLGKIIGGGFPVGAYGGASEIMAHISPEGGVYQAGTLSGNPVSVSAGLATLNLLKEKRPYEGLKKKTQDLARFIQKSAKKHGLSVTVNSVGSMFTVFFTDMPVTNYFTATQSDVEKYAAFFHGLLRRGVYFPPSQFEATFVSHAIGPIELEKTKRAIDATFAEMAKG